MPKIIREDNHTATVQLDHPGSTPIVIAKRNPDGTHNSTYMALSHHDAMKGYATGGEVKKDEEENNDQDLVPSEVSQGAYAKGGTVRGYFPGGVVTPDDAPAAVGADMMGGQSPADLQSAMVQQANPAPAAPMSAPALTGPESTNANVPATDHQMPGDQAPQLNMPWRVPAHTSETSTTTPGYNATDLENVRKSAETQKSLEGSLGAVNAQEAQANAEAYSKEAGIEGTSAKDAQAYAQRVQDWTNKYDQTMQTNIQAYQNAKIVPKSIFESGNLGQNIAAGLSLAMGALGGALTGTHQNVALDIFNKAIDRDMEAQKFNLEKQGQVTNMLGMYYKSALDMGAKAQDAKLIAKANTLSQIKDHLLATTSTIGSQRAQINGQISAGKIDEEVNRLMAEAHKTPVTSKSTDTEIANPMIQKVPDADRNNLQAIENRQELTNEIYGDIKKNGYNGKLTGHALELTAMLGIQPTNYTDLMTKMNSLNEKETAAVNTRFGEGAVKAVTSTLLNPKQSAANVDAQKRALDQLNANEYYNYARSRPLSDYPYKRIGSMYDEANIAKHRLGQVVQGKSAGTQIGFDGKPYATSNVPFTPSK